MTPDIFELFWSAYPKRVAKAKAREKFERALRKTTLDKILTALEWQREQAGWLKDDGEYVPHASTWLHNERWDDEPPKTTNRAVVVTFAPTCGECVEGWREDDMRRVYRCPCRTVKARTA
jgi:hypothetical protein